MYDLETALLSGRKKTGSLVAVEDDAEEHEWRSNGMFWKTNPLELDTPKLELEGQAVVTGVGGNDEFEETKCAIGAEFTEPDSVVEVCSYDAEGMSIESYFTCCMVFRRL